ncbi:MAG: T9SS type A sorting domain-containing protein, partial [Candidatus Sabulitectum sp.]|nr:T9SS type A sorting domain-containing protein [Candidatus Sabulitectum sp.]
ELPMWTEEAADLSVSHVSSISGNTPVTFTVTSGGNPVENSRVCIQKGDWKTGETYLVGYTNASGQVSLYATPATTGTMSATVWARNHISYRGVITVTGVGTEEANSPVTLNRFSPLSPNPATDTALLSFSIAAPSLISLQVYDLGGRVVTTLANDQMQAGNHNILWNLSDASGKEVPAGVYHVRLSTSEFSEIKSLMVLR